MTGVEVISFPLLFFLPAVFLFLDTSTLISVFKTNNDWLKPVDTLLSIIII